MSKPKTIEEVESILKEWVESDPAGAGVPVVGNSERSYSTADIYEEVKNRTPFGLQYANKMIDLGSE
jgi:hypothetical protein